MFLRINFYNDNIKKQNINFSNFKISSDMATTVKITTTTTSSSNTNAIVLNSGYIKTVPGLLKLFELVLLIKN